MFDRRLIKNFDTVLFAAVLMITMIGITMIYSATHRLQSNQVEYYLRQIFWFGIGLLAFLGIISFDYRKLVKLGYLFYALNLCLLILVLLKGGGAGARRWLMLGGFRFQPSELAKISVLLVLTQYISEKSSSFRALKDMLLPVALVAVPVLLILVEPDLGTTLVFFPMLLFMLYLAGLPLRYVAFTLTPILSMLLSLSYWYWIPFLAVLYLFLYLDKTPILEGAFVWGVNLIVGIVTPILWNFLKDYQKNRLLMFINPERDPLGAGYNIIQSKIAIGSGGFLGKGLFMGPQNQLNFLPEQHTDFIFSILGEEGGFLGAFILLSLYVLFLVRALNIAANAKDDRGSLLAGGIAGLFLFHVFINIGMTIGIMPVTGFPLPFMSYGGTALLTNLILVGLLESIRMRRYESHR